MVFPVKYRKTLLDEEMVQIITETAREISKRYDMEFERIGCDGNHIHLLCTAHPKIAPGQIGRAFKSITARNIPA
ncbi:Transposase IS200 like protein [Caballeronia udeis]|uniref:Transposase IS200 like protein n=1 Tax=Caballeronia udeis TaxID=1232866 RepID=A0A158IFB7_9BURK|nr:Transposase IS200 like protein [Caballeronia udeis]